MRKHSILLQPEQRQMLEALTNHGQAAARSIIHAQILLKSEQGWSNKQIFFCRSISCDAPSFVCRSQNEVNPNL